MVGCDPDYENLDHAARQLQRGISRAGIRRAVFPFFGNPNLKPEISSEYDGGFTNKLGEAPRHSDLFSRRVHNLIVTVPCAEGMFV